MRMDRQTFAAGALLAALGLLLSYWVQEAMPIAGGSPPPRAGSLAYPMPPGAWAQRLQGSWQRMRDLVQPEPHNPAKRGAQLAHALLMNKDNAFFDRSAFAQATLHEERHAVDDLAAYLEDLSILANVPAYEDYSKTRPTCLTERMAAIDLLEEMGRQPEAAVHQAAVEALAKVFNAALPTSTPLKRLAFAEKQDALAAVARIDSDRAFALYRSVENPKAVDFLENSMVVGLVDTGVPRAEAVDLVRQSRQRSED